MLEIKTTKKNIIGSECLVICVNMAQFKILFDYMTVQHYTTDIYGRRAVYCLEHRVYFSEGDTAYFNARLHDFPNIENKYTCLDKTLQGERYKALTKNDVIALYKIIPHKVLQARYNLAKDLFEAIHGKNNSFTFF